jgi:ankyrin repeat protein
LLYLHGSVDAMGASEYIFYDLDKLRHDHNGQIVLYFTFNRYDIRCDTIQDMLATFIAQIIGHFPTVGDTADTQLEQNRRHRSWNYADLLNWFDYYRQIGEIEGISCVINNFDECEPGSRKDFLDVFRYKSQIQERPWRLLITSHKPGALLNELSEAGWLVLDLAEAAPPTDETTPPIMTWSDTLKDSLMLENLEFQYHEDIIDQELRSITELEPGVRQIIADHVTSSKGWPMDKTINDIFGPIEELTIQTVLRKILSDLPNRDLALCTLSWILFSVRPITIWELEAAITFHEQHRLGSTKETPNSSVVEDILRSLAGIVSCKYKNLAIAQDEIRSLLTTERDSSTDFDSVCDILQQTAHITIARTCLEFLQSGPAKETLVTLYDASEHRGTHMAICCDGTNLYDYAIGFWLHHLEQAANNNGAEFKEDIDLFVRSGNAEAWAAAFWALSNPVTRSQKPYTSIYPILVRAGLLAQADALEKTDEDTSAAMIEACLFGHSDISMELISRMSHSTQCLEKALVAAGSYGDASSWLRIIKYVKAHHPDFPWKDQEQLVGRASWLGLCDILEALIDAKCPLEDSYPTPLRMATRTNSVDAIKLLLQAGAKPDHRNDEGRTALHLAASIGHPDVVRALVHGGGDIDSRSSSLVTPTYQSCLWGNFRACEVLLSLGANPNLNDRDDDQDELGWTPLIVAIQENHMECARILLEYNADPDKVAVSGSALINGIVYQSFDICKQLVDKGANVNNSKDTYCALSTALRQDVLDRRFDIVQLLVGNDASVNAVDSDDGSPLQLACWLDGPDQLTIVDLLLQHGADVNYEDKQGSRPIDIAITKVDAALLRRLLEEETIDFHSPTHVMWTPLKASHNNEDLTRILLEKGAEPNYSPNKTEPPITAAVRAGNLGVVQLLLEYGSSIDPPEHLKDDEIWEPLEVAVVFGKADIIRILCDNGANVNRQWDNGRTLLHKAMRDDGLAALLEFRPDLDIQADRGNAPLHEIYADTPLENIKLLVRAGSNINLTDKDNVTPLASALRNSHESGAKYLMSRKPKVNIVSSDWGAPLHLACKRGMIEIAQDLIKAGADVNLIAPGIPGSPLISVFAGYSPDLTDDDVKTRMINLLLSSGADITVCAGMFANIVGAAAVRGSTNMLRLVLSRGGQARVPDIMGRLPLHFAALRGELERVNVLFEEGEDAAILDKTGRTTLHWAAQGGSLEVFDRIMAKLDSSALNQPDRDGWTPLCWAARGCGAGNNLREIGEEDYFEFVKDIIARGADIKHISNIPGRRWTPWGIAKYHGRPQKVLDLLAITTQDAEEDAMDMPDVPEKHTLNHRTLYCDNCLYVSNRWVIYSVSYDITLTQLQNISGNEYSCQTCNLFYLCYKCYNLRGTLHNPDHEFTETGPEFIPQSVSEHSRPSSPLSGSEASSESNSDSDSESDGNEDTDGDDE